MINFLKGIAVGLGAIAPGLSGSVLLVIFGLYHDIIAVISTIFKDMIAKIRFLLPIAAGIGIGIVIFSKIVDFFLINYEMQTRFAFLGLILGAIPLFFGEVKKQGFSKKYYIHMGLAFAFGMFLFNFNRALFPVITEPSLLQSVLLGVAVAASYIVPGLDSAAILSALGLYNLWVHSLATLDFAVLIPALCGAGMGVLVVSYIMSKLIAKCYTATFSTIFGLFIAIIPTVFNESCVVGLNGKTALSFVILIVSFIASLTFSNLDKFKE